ncbi:polysaccharide biosynthesis protein [Actinocrinis puniceicyclus]|uniref:Polysaccharide biosynthesis protein n=1 Tax=Actinocrinis puniceicyclus TaxID=977794 RepID=A0A8J7WP79_9ACTN|nr:polysaccharide biosynthesis protein [Actinocrinis puniceicyclus]MBS2964923.1 polysaccharide biosynthesis protein [Actinocrinis puniceicyclus]
MESAASILDGMRAAVPPGRAKLSEADVRALTRLTERLRAVRPDAHEEYHRFQSIRERGLNLPHDAVRGWLTGRTVLVTGGTGCIGSMLVEQLAALAPARLVVVSRGTVQPWRLLPGAEYLQADIRDQRRIAELFTEVRPEIVFHVAAQREPGRAEVEVHRTVTTNVFGTRNILDAAAEHGVRHVVCASTGKALRPYSPDIYAQSKRVAEWLMARAAARGGPLITAARFTHVVDNSIVADRLRRWCKAGVVRLHSAQIDFYAQSALESAQLLLASGLGPRPGVARMHALRNLDWPVNLLDLALGMLTETRSRSPIYIAGYEDGYEPEAFPGLYDPRTAGGLSPLINAFEAASVVPGDCAETDAFELHAPGDDGAPLRALAELEDACGASGDPCVLRGPFEQLSLALLHSTLRDVPKPALARSIQLATARGAAPHQAHDRLLDALRHWAG